MGSSAGWYHLSITMSCIYSGLWYKNSLLFASVCVCVFLCWIPIRVHRFADRSSSSGEVFHLLPNCFEKLP